MTYTDYLRAIKNELQRTGRNKKSLRVKTIMEQFGYQRRSQAFIDDFNTALDELGLCANPAFDTYIPLDTKINIFIKGEPIKKATQSDNITAQLTTPIAVNYDFFYYLFDFGSEQEYERFQACLDSNQPIGIFLIPQKEDFFSNLVIKILNYELIRKYQYLGMNNIPESYHLNLSTSIDSDSYIDSPQPTDISKAKFFHFNRSTMTSALLGTTGLDLLDAEKFDEQFEQMSLYANRYNNEEFFIIFHCPSLLEIQREQKEDLLGYFIDRVASKIPFTFTLKCKYSNDLSVKQKEAIYSHFNLLLELPQYEIEEDDISLLNYFLELQKVQIQAESQLLLRMKHEYFGTLRWGQESAEHIYLKYFAIKTLENLGYDLSQIACEVEVSPDEEESTNSGNNCQKRRPDIYVENKIIVEVETLKGKGFGGNNVFFELIKRILAKLEGWTNKLESLWLVFPGFEIARNYYQLKKLQEILESKLTEKYGNLFQLLVMIPDYEKHQLIPVSFNGIEYPSAENFIISRVTPPLPKRNQLDFNQVKGLKEEKEKLSKILKLQSKGYEDAISGILFYGLPGCGKTLLANAFANESGRYFFKFSPADIISMWIGQSQKNIRDIFAQAKKKSPSVLFIDELDSIGFNRHEDNAHTDQKATINQLLIELNNLKDSNVIVIAATNYLSGIDSALKRSGRLDWKIPIFPPDKQERLEIFKHYLSQININHQIDILPIRRIQDEDRLVLSPFLPRQETDNALTIKMRTRSNLELVDFEILAEKSLRFTSSDIELVCREVRNALLLEEISSYLTTADIITYINNLQAGGLTLNKEQVKEFLDDCHRLSVKNPKLETLKLEWDLD
jgi:ATPase family associated with various cellular activities (AAA)